MRRLGLIVVCALSAAAAQAHAADGVLTDMECAVRYLTLAAGISNNPEAQKAYMGRAQDAGGRHARANPSLDQQALTTTIQGQAQARGEKIVAKQSSFMDLFIDVRVCDARYSYPLTPFPPGITDK